MTRSRDFEVSFQVSGVIIIIVFAWQSGPHYSIRVLYESAIIARVYVSSFLTIRVLMAP